MQIQNLCEKPPESKKKITAVIVGDFLLSLILKIIEYKVKYSRKALVPRKAISFVKISI